jgi:hypothetical protein
MTRTRQGGASVVVAELERATTAIRRRHPDLPDVVIALAGSRRKRGHYSHNRWTQNGADVAELFLAGEHLRAGAIEVLATLLHEGAHGLASARQIQDTSRDGRYHNRRYRTLAEEIGLHVQQAGTRGWTDTTITPTTIDAYTTTLGRLEKALDLWRKGDPPAKPPARTLMLAICPCERRIRVAPNTFQQGPITCGLCQQPFSATAPTSSDEE